MSPARPRTLAVSTVTALSIQGSWIKLLQAKATTQRLQVVSLPPAEATAEGPSQLLAIKARQLKELGEEAVAATLKELIRELPEAPKEVRLLLSSGEVLTRYLALPSEDPKELSAMSLYQLEGVLPYPVSECVTSVKILGKAGEATRVLVAAVHRPIVERLLRICKLANLSVWDIALSSEATGYWHRACWPGAAETLPEVLLFAEVAQETIDLGVLVKGSLIYMRQVPRSIGSLEELAAYLQETIQAYTKEGVGPPIAQVTLSGWQKEFLAAPLERLESALQLPVRRVDPLERSPFRESLSVTAQELTPEVSFTELLGAVCAPRTLGLDLLPTEVQLGRARENLLRELRWSAIFVCAAVAMVAAWAGTKVGGTWWALRQTQSQIQLLEPQVAKVKAMANAVSSVHLAREEYIIKVNSLQSATQALSQGMALQLLSFETGVGLTLRGRAPNLEGVMAYAAALRKVPLWKQVILHSAKSQQQGNQSFVEFEILLQMEEKGKK